MVDFRKLDELGFDPASAKERFLGREELYFSCLKIYIRTNDIARLTELCSTKNRDEAVKCVHTMKGSTGNLALNSMYALYSKMTELFRAGEPEKAVSMLPRALEMEEKLRAAAGITAE